jgi:hypothetical protein
MLLDFRDFFAIEQCQQIPEPGVGFTSRKGFLAR